MPRRKGDPVRFDTDECPRRDTSLEALGKLKPAFKKGGTVTAGNAPPVNDGASALVVASASAAKRLGLKARARVVAYASSGLAPELVMMAPEKAVRMVWEKTGWSAGDVQLYEFNEAFSVQQVALGRELGIDPSRHNVRGGAVALGHPHRSLRGPDPHDADSRARGSRRGPGNRRAVSRWRQRGRHGRGTAVGGLRWS